MLCDGADSGDKATDRAIQALSAGMMRLWLPLSGSEPLPRILPGAGNRSLRLQAELEFGAPGVFQPGFLIPGMTMQLRDVFDSSTAGLRALSHEKRRCRAGARRSRGSALPVAYHPASSPIFSLVRPNPKYPQRIHDLYYAPIIKPYHRYSFSLDIFTHLPSSAH